MYVTCAGYIRGTATVYWSHGGRRHKGLLQWGRSHVTAERRLNVQATARVYLHHLDEGLSIRDAHSPGAWSQVQFAKANRTKFMELAFKLLAAKKSTETVDRWEDDSPEILELVDRLLAKEGNGR